MQVITQYQRRNSQKHTNDPKHQAKLSLATVGKSSVCVSIIKSLKHAVHARPHGKFTNVLSQTSTKHFQAVMVLKVEFMLLRTWVCKPLIRVI